MIPGFLQCKDIEAVFWESKHVGLNHIGQKKGLNPCSLYCDTTLHYLKLWNPAWHRLCLACHNTIPKLAKGEEFKAHPSLSVFLGQFQQLPTQPQCLLQIPFWGISFSQGTDLRHQTLSGCQAFSEEQWLLVSLSPNPFTRSMPSMC